MVRLIRIRYVLSSISYWRIRDVVRVARMRSRGNASHGQCTVVLCFGGVAGNPKIDADVLSYKLPALLFPRQHATTSTTLYFCRIHFDLHIVFVGPAVDI